MYNYNYFETSVQTEWTIYKFSEDFWLIVFVKIYIDEMLDNVWKLPEKIQIEQVSSNKLADFKKFFWS